MLTQIWNIWLELAPWLLLGAAVAGALHALLPPGFLERNLRGRAGVARAVLLGVPLPLCSCGVIPTGLGLKKQGAGDGATVGFLISTPQTGVDSVFVTAAMLGWPFALFKLAWAGLTGLIGGWIAEWKSEPLRAEASPPSAPIQNPLEVIQPPEAETVVDRSLRGAVAHGVELLYSIWRWIVAGVLVSAAISAWMPADGLQALSGYGGMLGMLAALVISLPLYVCATASVPIAASLVAAGLPTGAALVFLMAGPATNVATLGAVYRTLGRRQLAVYLSTIIAGSIVGGLLFAWLIDSTTAMVALHEHAAPWWAVASGVALAALFAWFVVKEVRSRFAVGAVSDGDVAEEKPCCH